MATAAISVRIPVALKAALERMTAEDGVTEATELERLITDEAIRQGHIPPHHPDVALVQLERAIEPYLDREGGCHGEHITRACFAHIQKSHYERYLRAIEPPSPSQEHKARLRYVHQRLGRFVKDYLGLDSLGEVILPPNSGNLIRAYTRLGNAAQPTQ